ncbi:hypothetical protein Tco_0536752 [Tanacetum coccineum]
MLRNPTNYHSDAILAGNLTDKYSVLVTLTKEVVKKKGVEDLVRLEILKDNKKQRRELSFPQFLSQVEIEYLASFGNQLALEGSRNNRSNGNQVRGRAFNVNVNAMEAVQDPKVVTEQEFLLAKTDTFGHYFDVFEMDW